MKLIGKIFFLFLCFVFYDAEAAHKPCIQIYPTPPECLHDRITNKEGKSITFLFEGLFKSKETNEDKKYLFKNTTLIEENSDICEEIGLKRSTSNFNKCIQISNILNKKDVKFKNLNIEEEFCLEVGFKINTEEFENCMILSSINSDD